MTESFFIAIFLEGGVSSVYFFLRSSTKLPNPSIASVAGSGTGVGVMHMVKNENWSGLFVYTLNVAESF